MSKGKKLISLAFIALLTISGCSNNASSENSSSTTSESTSQTTEEKLSAIDYDTFIPDNFTIQPANSAGIVYMHGNYVNKTPYNITSYVLYYMDKGTTESSSLNCFETVLAGETSPQLESIGPASGNMDDLQYQSLSLTLQTDEGVEYGVEYDYQLDEVSSIFEITE